MIISASRRTDLPAYYSRWLMNRLHAGFCLVPNPFNPRLVARVSLLPSDVEAIVFWTRDARPMLASLSDLDRRGYRYVFLVTVVDYPAPLGPGNLPVPVAVQMFRRLAERIGHDRVVWRYDPIVFSNVTDGAFHARQFAFLADELWRSTRRVIISGLSFYRRNLRSLKALEAHGVFIRPKEDVPVDEMESMLGRLASVARERGLDLVSCAETLDWRRVGIAPGRCIDDAWLGRVLGVRVPARKDPGQRQACGCVVSRDIGVYGTCVRGCPYCYAVSDPEEARRRFGQHDPDAPSLVPLPHEAGIRIGAAERPRHLEA